MKKTSCTEAKRQVGLKSIRTFKQAQNRYKRRIANQTLKTNPEAIYAITDNLEKRTSAWDIS